MDSKFDIGDLVVYEGKLFKVASVHYLNPQIPSDPFVCGLVLNDDRSAYPRQLMVRQGLLEGKGSEPFKRAIKVLYGK